MKKKIFIFCIGMFVLIAIAGASIYVYGFKISVPRYDDEYFSRNISARYSSPELAFQYFVSSLENGDTKLYQEVLGRNLSDRELHDFKSFDGKRPQILKMSDGKVCVFIETDNNWGEFFEKVKDRWVFTPEDLGVNIRAMFR